MKIDKTISKVFVLSLVISLVLASCTSWQKAEASIFTITNHTRSELEINVVTVPNGTPYCKKCLASPLRICGRETVKIIIPLDEFKGGEYFSILDVSNGFMGESKCQNLNVLKNYEVSFFETTLGTRALCKEI